MSAEQTVPPSQNKFGDTAVKLSQGPLGIIALFIVLVHGFACLVVGLGGPLDSINRSILIGFLVIFPLYVFTFFSLLVWFRHTKLYPPGAFRDDETFKILAFGKSNVDKAPTKAPDLKYAAKEISSVAKDQSGHIFWLGHDLMWTADTLLRSAPIGQTLNGIDQAIFHLDCVGLEKSAFKNEIKTIREQIQNASELSVLSRADYANKIGAIIDNVGAIMEAAQPDFKLPPHWCRIRENK